MELGQLPCAGPRQGPRFSVVLVPKCAAAVQAYPACKAMRSGLMQAPRPYFGEESPSPPPEPPTHCRKPSPSQPDTPYPHRTPPRQVRVFSIQRVSKSWNARSECIRRTYSYYLPASALGLALDGGERDEKRLALLAAAWQRFEGTHPFHNYTKRRLYREGEGGGSGGRRRKSRAEQDAEAAASSEAGSEGSEPEPDCEGGAGAGATAAAAAAPAPAGDGPSPAAGAEGAPAAAGEAVPARKGRVVLQWKTEKDASDLVVRRHFR